MRLLLPATDAGVAIQAVATLVCIAALLIVFRHDRDLRMLLFGVAVLAAGFFSVRALH
ncbi:MAG: hypothetical protein H0U92_10445 [Actinobacteria bacterium]|nr:hypothetical protein [Actinomycetota bacterium]